MIITKINIIIITLVEIIKELSKILINKKVIISKIRIKIYNLLNKIIYLQF